jgi:hypothetical protein
MTTLALTDISTTSCQVSTECKLPNVRHNPEWYKYFFNSVSVIGSMVSPSADTYSILAYNKGRMNVANVSPVSFDKSHLTSFRRVSVVTTTEPDVLSKVKPIPPSEIEVIFADGRSGVIDVAALGLNIKHLNLSSVRVSEWGSSVEIDDLHGQSFPIDSSVLRSKIDPIYDAKTKRANHKISLETVLEARYVHPDQVYLHFIDGLEGTWTFEELQFDIGQTKPNILKVSDKGDYVEVIGKKGNIVKLDSASMRYLIDGGYATEVDSIIRTLTKRINP